jgi:hypothetical protein
MPLMPKSIRSLVLLCAFLASRAGAAPFDLAPAGAPPVIVHDGGGKTLGLAAAMLRHDLRAVSGVDAATAEDLSACSTVCVVVGTAASPAVQRIAREGGVDLRPLRGQWERYLRAAVRDGAGRRILLVAGSDVRGAVYGVVDIGRELGVSAWEWWADVAPRRNTHPAVDGAVRLSAAPSVQYRGIFLNDEDWGLQPWAAAHDPAGDIGPTTYAHIFELMWRLKANLIWPAMHESTKPFYQIDGNARTAADYAIVVGTSHAEPMMRNNVREWDSRKNGPFNFFTNRAAMADYWRRRVDEVKDGENVYSVGLRGVHDSALEGAATPEQARAATEDAIRLQRSILAHSLGRPAAGVPQALTLYKEVLDLYKAGMRVPDDVTLVWPDDNYGYLHQLSDADERRRTGGAGIYYHISYWGRPHDYLWLGTTHPALIRDQLQRAWATGARKLWVVNLGDIKPAEYLVQYFLDAAFDARQLDRDPQRHLDAWSAAQFGPDVGAGVARILRGYYDLAWERRPEFMGFGQVEPITPNRRTAYMASGGEEGARRLERYTALAAAADALAQRVPFELRDAYAELVAYPVHAAAGLNTRILDLDLAAEAARQGRPSARHLVDDARRAHARLVADTAAYNGLAGGKWRGIMDMAPRRLPVFAEPVWPSYAVDGGQGCGIVYPFPYSADADRLAFVTGVPATATVTLSARGGAAADWRVTDGARGIATAQRTGTLDAGNGFEQRIVLRYDGSDDPAVAFRCGGRDLRVNLRLEPRGTVGVPAEHGHIVSIAAGSAAAQPDWELQPGLGSSGRAMRARLDLRPRAPDRLGDAAPLAYAFDTTTDGGATLRLVALPEHPLAGDGRVRIAYSLDGGPVAVADYTTFGRSDEWKRNVLSNSAVRTAALARLRPGRHTLKVYALDPGVVLDRIDVVLDGAPELYGAPRGIEANH